MIYDFVYVHNVLLVRSLITMNCIQFTYSDCISLLFQRSGLYVVMGLHIRGDNSVGAPVGYYIEDIISVKMPFLTSS